MAKTELNEALPAATAATVGNPIDQVRELLFGADKRSHEQRFDELDRKLERELDVLRAHVETRFSEIEAALAAATAAGDADRRKAVEKIGDAIGNLGDLIKRQAT